MIAEQFVRFQLGIVERLFAEHDPHVRLRCDKTTERFDQRIPQPIILHTLESLQDCPVATVAREA